MKNLKRISLSTLRCLAKQAGFLPVLGDSFRVKEKCSRYAGLCQEICSQRGNPFENAKSSTRFKDEESDGLLEKEANDDSGPNFL